MPDNQQLEDTPQAEPMITLKDISVGFNNKPVLDKINLTVHRNEIVAIVGPSGTGKSSMIRIITGLLTPQSGEVILGSERIGLAFQYGALFSSMTVAENISLVLEQTTDLDDDAIEERIEEALNLVGLMDSIDKHPNELSGGMQKRVGIARALAIHPDIMLYDEPSAGLDPILAHKLEVDLRRINEDRQIASLLVTHELPTIQNLADRVIMLYHGEVVYEGTRQDFFSTTEPHALQYRTRREAGPIEV